jgi:hypothetical protein
MNLQGIVAVSGKPGLWRALAQNKTGYILEGLDANKTKLVANLSTAKIAALNEITLFGELEDIKLVDIFERMKITPNIPDAKADGKILSEYFREVAPAHDEEKVYASDMKKVVTWFGILKGLPLFEEAVPDAPENTSADVEESPSVESSAVAEEAATAEETSALEEVPAPEVVPANEEMPEAEAPAVKKNKKAEPKKLG